MTTPINIVGEGLVGVDHRVNSSLEHGRIVAIEGDGESRRYRVEIESRRQRTPGVDAPTYQVIAIGYTSVPIEVLRHDGTPLLEVRIYGSNPSYSVAFPTIGGRPLAVGDNVMLLGNGGTYFIVATQPVQVRATSG